MNGIHFKKTTGAGRLESGPDQDQEMEAATWNSAVF